MWLLRNDSKGLLYRVTPGKQHVVSRKDGDLLLSGDQSISRKHAQLIVGDENGNEGIVVKDLQSKYGTFTVVGNGEVTQMTPNQEVTLKSGDFVRFGVQWNSWRVECVPLLVATSTLTAEEKAELKELVTTLGGRVVSDWQDKCTHLTMNKLTVTVKVVCALASGQPIVTPAYWKSFTQALSTLQSTLPDCKDFLPPLAEAVLNPDEVSFKTNPKRSKLFNGLTFVAATAKQLSRIKPMVTAAGGNAVVFSAKVWSEDKLLQDKNILMQHSATDKQGSQLSQIPDGYIAVARKLKTQGVRCVPESEIGLSVLYCSLTQYCNTRFSTRGGSSSLEATQPVTVICPNTEESVTSCPPKTECDPEMATQPYLKKRAHEDENEEEEQASKKQHTHANSEDLFSSQQLNNARQSRNSNISLSLKKTTSASASTSVPKVPVIPDPSLDMFAPSGEQRKASKGRIVPSCEDLFASATIKPTKDKKSEENDEFSFTKNKQSKNLEENPSADGDEFMFTSSKKTLNQLPERIEDSFSFRSCTKSQIPQEKPTNEVDDFSFPLNRRSSKRSRQSNPDMFASSTEFASNDNGITAGPSKIRKTEGETGGNRQKKKESPNVDNAFDFPVDHKQKRKRHNKSLIDLEENDSKVKIALFSRENESVAENSGLQAGKELKEVENPIPDPKTLVTYSKSIPSAANIKVEGVDEEVDKLARELDKATLVFIQPLVVVKPNPANSSAVVTGKNFKKFRKVLVINKQMISHIIGGSDLVPHQGGCLDNGVEESLPPSPGQESPDDDWGFGSKSKTKNKTKGKAW